MNPSKWSATRLESAASHQKARNAAPSSNACRTTERRRSSCAGRTPDACTRSVSISNISVFFFFFFTFYFVSTRRLIASNSAVVSAEVNEGNTQSNDSSISGKLTGPVDDLRATLLDEILAF